MPLKKLRRMSGYKVYGIGQKAGVGSEVKFGTPPLLLEARGWKLEIGLSRFQFLISKLVVKGEPQHYVGAPPLLL